MTAKDKFWDHMDSSLPRPKTIVAEIDADDAHRVTVPRYGRHGFEREVELYVRPEDTGIRPYHAPGRCKVSLTVKGTREWGTVQQEYFLETKESQVWLGRAKKLTEAYTQEQMAAGVRRENIYHHPRWFMQRHKWFAGIADT